MSAPFLFLGASDIQAFGICKDWRCRIHKFKAATAKGLGQGNQNSQKILQIVQRARSTRVVVWMFGTVDVKFSFLHKLCTQQDVESDSTMMMCAVRYMEFVKRVHSLLPPAAKTIVIGVEPNNTPPIRLFEQCVKYRVMADTEENKRIVKDEVARQHPEAMRQTFNDILQHLCKVNGFEYLDIDDGLLTDCRDPNVSVVTPVYRDAYELCIHLNWEGTVALYQPKLRALGVDLHIDLGELERTRKEYLEEKAARPQKRKAMDDRLGIDSEPVTKRC